MEETEGMSDGMNEERAAAPEEEPKAGEGAVKGRRTPRARSAKVRQRRLRGPGESGGRRQSPPLPWRRRRRHPLRRAVSLRSFSQRTAS